MLHVQITVDCYTTNINNGFNWQQFKSIAGRFLCIWFIFDNEDADTDNDQEEADQ